ncbi:hypothetical protein F5Y09DRAFT_339005 [Xylaria sp. FL1042]|nr:hypothetical protein F5Y09DRAFT_339005 [Xylaria sp. FL1042]
MASTIQEIKNLYDAGVPLFTKDALRKIAQKLSTVQQTPPHISVPITVTGINGTEYQILAGGDPWLAPEGSKWVINYRSIQSLTVHKDTQFRNSNTAYLSLGIIACTWVPKVDTLLKNPQPSKEWLLHDFQDRERQWKASKAYEELRTALSAIKTPFVLDKLVAVALGPLVFRCAHLEHSMIQSVLVSAIHSNLLERGILSASSKIYVQDPAYTQLDQDVLSSVGFNVIDDPEAFLMLDDSSVLVSISPDIPVKQIVVDICRPAIIIWSKVWDNEESLDFYITDPTSSRVDKMLKEEYYELEFPVHKNYSGLIMYVRKTA